MEPLHKATGHLMLTWMFALAIGMLAACSGCIHTSWSKCDYDYDHRLRRWVDDPLPTDIIEVVCRLERIIGEPEDVGNTLMDPVWTRWIIVRGSVPGIPPRRSISVQFWPSPLTAFYLEKKGVLRTFRFTRDGKLIDVKEFGVLRLEGKIEILSSENDLGDTKLLNPGINLGDKGAPLPDGGKRN